MTYENFTVAAQDAILKGQRLAAGLNQEEVTPSHLLLGVMDADDVLIPQLFKNLQINLPLLKRELYNHIEKLPKSKSVEKQKLTTEANALLLKAKQISKELGDNYITPELIVLALIDVQDPSSTLLKGLGFTQEAVKKAILDLRQGKKVVDQANATPLQNLNKYAINLNEKAAQGKLDKIVGRDDEIRRIIHILSRKTKNNPILVGDPGVGKSAIVEGIAQRIVEKDVPENLLSKQIYALDLAGIVAGAKYKGEFEERLKFIIDDVKSSDGAIILFMEDIHTLVGAGGGNGAMDAAGILKPALSREEIIAIGTTTPEEYQKYFESDKTLASKFQNIDISEPSIDETISILRGAQHKYESFHNVGIKDDALKAAAELSSRYVTDRKLPDKALDLIDEAASKLKLELESVPDSIDEMSRKIKQLQSESDLLKKEKNASKMTIVEEQLLKLKATYEVKSKLWEKEKQLAHDIQNNKAEIEKTNHDFESLEEKSPEALAEKTDKVNTLQAQLTALEKQLADIPEEDRFTSGEVTADDIASVISKWTGIPVNKMLKSDKERLLSLEAEIGKRLIGQKEAVVAVCDAVRRSRAGLQDPNKPIGSFIFLGPTGVGKTELAKALAEVLFDDENAITRIDMSEYQEKQNVSRLVGAPPGYVGYDEGGQLTEAVRRRPYTIVLLDEIEKAHPDTFNILLQLLDDGRLTDNKGRTANFRNTIVIMTSNMGSDKILENFEDLEHLGEKHRVEIIENTKEEVLNVLKENLKPEFLNRIDEKIVFTPLSKDEVKQIATLMLKKVSKNLGLQGMKIEFTSAAMNLIVDMGYDPAFGARPLKRVIDKELVNHLAKEVLAGDYAEGDTIYVNAEKSSFTFSKTKPANVSSNETTVKIETTTEKPDNTKSEKSHQLRELEKATNEVIEATKELKQDKEEKPL